MLLRTFDSARRAPEPRILLKFYHIALCTIIADRDHRGGHGVARHGPVGLI